MSVAARWDRPDTPSPVGWWAQPEGPQFVGRAEELHALELAWSSAVRGRRQVVLVLGEAGAGKSRLVAEASALLAQQGAVVVVGGCLPDAPVAYEPFRSPLARLAEDLGGTHGGPELEAVRDLLAAPGGSTGSATGGSLRAREAFEAVGSVLRWASAQRPLILMPP